MPKVGMEPLRRAALVDATIDCIGRAGSLDVTVSEIAKAAGMSSALAHHYFGAKDQIFLAAMRHILTGFGAAVRAQMQGANTPRARVEAILRASFDSDQFSPSIISAWLNFYVKAQISPDAARLLAVYQRRLRSNMIHDLRPLVGARAEESAQILAALIDGLYIRAAIGPARVSPKEAVALCLTTLDQILRVSEKEG